MADTSRHWFVAADAGQGDGSRAKPFHDPWLALRAAGPGDSIHLAAGIYLGRYERSSWFIDAPNLTILGGYRRDFSTRSPWQTPSVLAALPGYEAVRENCLIAGRGDHSGLVLDGLLVDGAGRNSYGPKPAEGLSDYPTMDGGLASFSATNVTVRNCIFANSATGGVELSGDGSRFENNLVINLLGIGMLDLRRGPSESGTVVTVIGNSFCFAFDTAGPPFGNGADNAIGVRVSRSAVIQKNVFVACGNSGLAIFRDIDRVSVDGNLFYLTLHDIAVNRASGSALEITEGSIDEMEDLGFKSASGNVVQDAGVSGLEPPWLDAYSRHVLGLYAKPPREALNALCQKVGLPALAPTDVDKPDTQGALAPRLSAESVVCIRFACPQGMHPVECPVSISDQPPVPSASYRPVEWGAMAEPELSLANQRVELRAGLGHEQNAELLSDATPETHMGIRVYQPGTDDGSIFVLARRSTLVSRQFEDAIKANNGREVETPYLLRGVYRMDLAPSFRQKVTLVLESIGSAPIIANVFASRSTGRDWFVKAGASGGDGSREKPFRDPFQALEKAEGGDAVHVAGGDYFGKLHSGQWKILIRYLTLFGGYDAEFAARDPWKNPTRLVMSEDEKSKKTLNGLILDSEENSEGLVLDGFIFDGASYNTYSKNGSLDLSQCPSDSMVRLLGAQAPITVRNCVFLNSAAEAISISCPYGVFENNLLINSSRWGLKLNAAGAGPWTIRRNTFLFAADPSDRAGTGKSAPDGTLVVLSGRAAITIESNIFAFADNYGVRSGLPQPIVALNGNVFAGNLFNHLTDGNYLWADSSSWPRRVVLDSALASVKDNTFSLPTLPVDPAYSDIALKRLFSLPSRIKTDEWQRLAATIGSSAIPTAPATPSPVVEATKPVAASLADLIAGLNKPKTPVAAVAPTDSAPEVIYCLAYSWKKALSLVQESAEGPGAHRVTIPVSFAAVAPHVDVQYLPLSPEMFTGELTAFDGKAVEVEVGETRESSTNPANFPAAMTKDDYAAFSALVLGTSARISLVARLDTNVSKALSRITSNDKLRIRGTARVLGNPRALAIVADSAEATT